jgi:translation initiation factor IF-3
VNERIRARQVRLIGADGKQIGVVPLEEALRQARVEGLDLVEVNATAAPSVCRLLDYGKYQYEQDKRERESRKKQKRVEVKGVRISFKMGAHDRNLRKSLAEKFLKAGNKVRVEMVLRGREKALRAVGIQQLQAFLHELDALARVEEAIGQAPRGLAATIAPKK